jgi:drug/metabolite transporter (DMT)-like permease
VVHVRLYVAWVLLIGSLIGWPLTQFTIAKEEPPFILGLSWLAIILTAADLLSTTDVRHKEDGDQ